MIWGSRSPSSTLRRPVLRTSHAWGSCWNLGVQAQEHMIRKASRQLVHVWASVLRRAPFSLWVHSAPVVCWAMGGPRSGKLRLRRADAQSMDTKVNLGSGAVYNHVGPCPGEVWSGEWAPSVHDKTVTLVCSCSGVIRSRRRVHLRAGMSSTYVLGLCIIHMRVYTSGRL